MFRIIAPRRTPAIHSAQTRPQAHRGDPGFSLIEMLVVLVIVSVLAAMAAPLTAKRVQREKELTLRAHLREVRTAIDRFHEDWRESKGAGAFAKVASPDGYPVTLDALVEGVDAGDATGRKRRYLRQVPRNPFLPVAVPVTEHWAVVGYQDDPKAKGHTTGAKDVYDIRSAKDGEALDGSRIAQW